MARLIYTIGLLVSILGICLWPVIVFSQLKEIRINPNFYKRVLLAFGVIAFITNIAPGYYDIYRILHPTAPGPITFLKIASDITFRAAATGAFFMIYSYSEQKK